MKRKKIVDNLIEMKDVVVPILGDDIFFIARTDGRRTGLHEYLLDCFTEEYGERGLTTEDREIILKGSYYGLSKLERFFPSDFETDFRRYIRTARKEGLVEVQPVIRDFLETFRFPLIITTTPFSFIEDMLPGYSTAAYSPKGVNNAPVDDSLPMVYHIFGTIADGGQWVYDEGKLLEFLHTLHNEDTTSKALKRYMDSKNCRLLALGCNLPDWLFRFLWYPIKSATADPSQKKGFWISERETPESFNDFLDNIKFYSAREVHDILSMAVDSMREMKKEVSGEKEEETRYDAFLSYASEDKELAGKVFDLLTAKGYRVWFDKDGHGKIEPGSNYMRRIEAGIARSAHYIPLITGNFVYKVLNPESNLKKETDLVRNHHSSLPSPPDRYSIPIIVDGSVFNEQPITSTMIEGLTLFILPKALFYQINMYTYRPGDTAINFEL